MSFASTVPDSPTDDEFEPEPTQESYSYIDIKLASRKRKLGGAPAEPRKKKGKLSALLELMPNEILVHICSYLHPTDLLHITQSSKIFALFLLAPSSSYIWYTSRQELDSEMPARPNDLSEQQYCALIFGLYCQKCGVACRATSNSVIWMLRRRWCEKCRKEIAAENDPNYVIYPYNRTIGGIVSIGSLRFGRSHVQVARKPELESVQSLVVEDDVPEDHAGSIQSWMEAYAQGRSNMSSDLRTQRIEDLKDFLQEEGYFRPLLNFIPHSDYLELPGMKNAKRLTLRGWNMSKAKLLPLVDNAIERSKEVLITMALRIVKTKYDAYCRPSLPSTAFFPMRIQEVPQVKAAMTAWIEDPDVMRQFIAEQMQCELPIPEEVPALFPSYISENRQALESFFLGCLPFHERLQANKTPEEILDLAISVFCATEPSDNPFFAERRANLPFRVAARRQTDLHYVDGQIDAAALKDHWTFDSIASSIISTIVVSLGLDVDHCTHDQIEAADCFVRCQLCQEGSSYATMHWEQAINHWHKEHADRAPSDALWGVLTAEEKEAVLPPWMQLCYHSADLVLPNGETILERVPYDCALCPERPTLGAFHGFSGGLRSHFQFSHDLQGDTVYDAQYRVRSRRYDNWYTIHFPLPISEPSSQSAA
ncbi:hypothetical protein DL93DRAFT_2097477 [Clavulina sp. PMI_390]|nr:hypothetical protein DL93DRAFT_2097477 [Clavulina sp. PMI_390]